MSCVLNEFVRLPRARCIGALIVTLALAAPAHSPAGTFSPPSFAAVDKPSWRPEDPREPEQIVPRGDFGGAQSWICLDQSIPSDTPGESRWLIRLSVVLETSQIPRAAVEEARNAAIDAGISLIRVLAESSHKERRAGASGDPVMNPGLRDPTFKALAALEVEAHRRWAAIVPWKGDCSESVALGGRALETASLMLQRDVAFSILKADIDALLREARVPALSSGDSGPSAVRTSLEKLEKTIPGLEAAEGRWLPIRRRLEELLGGLHSQRSLRAAARAEILESLREILSRSPAPSARPARHLVARAASRQAALAALLEPSLIVEQSSFLDLRQAPPDTARAWAVQAIISSLQGQLAPLEVLYGLTVKRQQAFLEAAPSIIPPEIEALDRRASEQWYRLARAVRSLGEHPFRNPTVGWAWTEVGVARDRLLSLETALARLEADALWTDATPAFFDAVNRQEELISKILIARSGEYRPFAAIQRSARDLLGAAAQTSRSLEELAASLGKRTPSGRSKTLLAITEQVLLQRSDTLAGDAALALELSGQDSESPERHAFGFLEATRTLAILDDLQALVESQRDAEQVLREIAVSGSAAGNDALLLEAALLLDLPIDLTIRQEGLIVGLGFGSRKIDVHVGMTGLKTVSRASWARRDSERPFRAVLRWKETGRSPGRPWQMVPVASAPVPSPDFALDSSRTPPGWEAAQQRAREDLAATAQQEAVSTGWGNWVGYGVGGALVVVGAVAASGPVVIAGLTVVGVNLAKDTITGVAKALNDAYGSVDPRDRAVMEQGIDRTRWTTDVLLIPVGAAGAESGAEIVDAGASLVGAAASPPRSTEDPSDPYLKRVAAADRLITDAFAAAKACRWEAARSLVYQAAAEDPFKQSRKWSYPGNRVMELAQEWERFGGNARASLISARERAEDEVLGCGQEGSTLPAHLAMAYKDEARWACDESFIPEMERWAALARSLERIRVVLGNAEGSCDAGAAERLARQVVDWTQGTGQRFHCAGKLRTAAQEVLEWTSRGGEDPIQRLGRARQAIENCRLDEASEILGSAGNPSRCTDPSLKGVIDETRTELLEMLRAREQDGERLEGLRMEAESAIKACDADGISALRIELGNLHPCLEGFEGLRSALTERLRTVGDLASGGAVELLQGARDSFNEAIRLADTGCDMGAARIEVEEARAVLTELMMSSCFEMFGGEVQELANHGSYVEQQVEAREAVLGAIRSSFDAGEAAFTAAMENCSRVDLVGAVAMLEKVNAGIDAIPIMADPSCEAMVGLSEEATRLLDEASILIDYWDELETDLERARQAALEGRRIDIDLACAGVRRKAQPALCFGDALAECEALTPGLVTPTPTPLIPPPAPSPSTNGGEGSGRVQIDGPEPCARDMSWAPARQRFECSCPGYRFDEALERCVQDAGSARVSQAACDSLYPGTRLGTDPETGRPACLCPTGTAWSSTGGRCLELLVPGSGPSARTSCDPATGRFYNPATGRCECTVGTWNPAQGRCIDTSAANRQRAVDARRKGSECELLYSRIEVFRRNPNALYRQQAAAAEARARRLGCDPGRISEAISRADRPRINTSTGGPSSGSQARNGGGGSGSTGGGGSGSDAGGTCHIINPQGGGDLILVFRQQGAGNHVNVYLTSATEENADAVISEMGSLPGFSYIGSYGSVAFASGAAKRICRGRRMY